MTSEQSKQLSEYLARRPHHMVHMGMMDMGYDERAPYEVRDGIAIVDISGPLVSFSDWWDQSYKDIVEEVDMAVADGAVKGILLQINSPGGETDHAFEAFLEIEMAGKQKPIWAVADVNAYSAGYLLACSAERIYAAPISGGVGSIGVYGVHLEYSKALEKAGIGVTVIKAGDGKADGNMFEPLSKDALARITTEIERIYGEFVNVVSRRRRMTAEQVRALGAQTFHGAAATLASGLADRIGTCHEAIDEMIAYTSAASAPRAYTAAASAANSIKETKMSETNTADVTKTTPEVVTAIAEPVAAVEHPAAATAVASVAIPATQLPDLSASMEEIVELCSIAGLTINDARAMHAKKLTSSSARAELVNRAAEADRKTNTISGSPGPGTSASGDIEAETKRVMAGSPGLTREQAVLKAVTDNPNLYQQYINGRRAK